MDIQNLVVARYQDGRVLKGTTRDFSPIRPSFHVEVGSTNDVVEIRCRQLKALFFVKTFEGDSVRQDIRGFVEAPQEVAQGRKIAVRFKDGEFMCGYTLSWTPDREGFFLFPADPESNNQRVYVITSATAEIKAGPMADALAQRVLNGAAAAPAAAKPSAPAPRPGVPPAAAPPSALAPRPSALAPRPSEIAPRPQGLGPRPPKSDAA